MIQEVPLDARIDIKDYVIDKKKLKYNILLDNYRNSNFIKNESIDYIYSIVICSFVQSMIDENNIKKGGNEYIKRIDDNDDYLNNSMKNYISKSKLIYNINNDNFSIKIFSNYKKKKLINIVIRSIERLNLLIKDLKKKYNIDVNFLNVYIVDCPNKRKFIDNKIYINGGFTDINSNNIFIYRSDELCKVLLHEYLHHQFIYKYSNEIYKNDPLNRYILIDYNESIIEFLATIYQCKFTNTLIKDEIKYNKKIAEYVLSMELLNKTNIYSYVIIKYILMLNYKNVLKNILNKKWIYNYIDNYKLKLKPNYSEKNELIMVSCSNL
jgi:hypothetical protein